MSAENVVDSVHADDSLKSRPGLVSIVIALFLAFVNALLGYLIAEATIPQESAYFGAYAVAYVLRGIGLWQTIGVALFSIGKRFRNPKSATKIYCWISVLVIFGTMAQIGGMLHD